MKFVKLHREDYRIKSFRKCTTVFNVPELAASGFYYHKGDIICFYCNFKKNEWSINEKVYVEHNAMSSECPMLQYPLFHENVRSTNNILTIIKMGCLPLSHMLTYESRLATITNLFTTFGEREHLAVWGFIQVDQDGNSFMCYACRTMTPTKYPSSFNIQEHHLLSNPHCTHSIKLYGAEQWDNMLQKVLKKILNNTNSLETYIY